MVKPKIIEQRPVGVAEVKDILKTIHKRDEELSFRGGKTEEYVNDVSVLASKKAKDIVKALNELGVPRLKEQHVLKIADTLPQNAEQLKLILSGYNLTVVKDNLKKIMDVVDEYRPAK